MTRLRTGLVHSSLAVASRTRMQHNREALKAARRAQGFLAAAMQASVMATACLQTAAGDRPEVAPDLERLAAGSRAIAWVERIYAELLEGAER